ncbi:MAG: hypothetical protein H7Z41_12075 [Cytophagales bacterium]|nr:hypothetical protein [Armatimonadota bacterium]
MSRTTFYRQCGLQRANTRQRAWIPERFAVEGKVLGLKREDGVWEEGWLVATAGDIRLSGEVVSDRSQDYKRTRAASDL